MRTTLCILSLLSFFTLSAQQPALVVQVGHSQAINDIEYSPDGKYIATCSDDNSIKIWEIATGKEMKTLFGHTKPVNGIAYAPDAKTLVSVSDDRTVLIWDVEKGTILKTIKEHRNKVLDVDYSPTGEYFATCGKDKVVLLHNVSSGKVKEIYEFKSEVNRVKFENSGAYLYAETDKLLSKNAFFSIPQGKMITWVPGGGATAMSFDQDGKKFLTGRVYSGTPTIGIIKDWREIENWRKSREPLWKGFYPYNFQDTTGDYKIFSFKKQANYDLKNIDSDAVGAVSNVSTLATFFSKDGKGDVVAGNQYGELLFWRYDDINFYPRTINPYSKLNEKLDNMYVTPYKAIQAHKAAILDAVSSKNGDYIFTSAKNGEMKLWDVALERNIQTFTTDVVRPMESVAFADDSKTVLISTGQKDRYIVDLGTMQITDHFELEYPIERIAFTANRRYALMAYYNSSYFHLWDMRDKKAIRTFKGHLGEITSLKFAAGETAAVSTATEGKKITWSLETGEILKNEIAKVDPLFSEKHQATIQNNRIEAALSGVNGSHTLRHNNRITSLGFTPDEKFAFTASLDGSLSLWDPVTGDLVVNIIVTTQDEVIAVAKDYNFLASKAALKGIAFNYKDKMYPFEQFDFKFNRPDIVLERIGYADKRLIKAYKIAYKKRSAQIGTASEELDFKVPSLSLDLAAIPRSSGKRNLSFTVDATDEAGLEQLQVKVNGVPLRPIAVQGKDVQQSVSVALSAGDNKIDVAVINVNGISSLKQTFEVKYILEAPVKRDLYLITVGVSAYENSAFDLTYASKDAKDVAHLFKVKFNDFNQVHHLNFLDEQATPENITSVRAKLENSQEDDYVVFFFAGHGLLASNLDYYLATHHTKFDNPSDGGLAYQDVEALLSYIPARNKIIYIDACHSGELEEAAVQVVNNATGSVGNAQLKTRGYTQVRAKMTLNQMIGYSSMFKFMKSIFADVRENTGSIVISSAGGKEYALESDRWKNGVFTYYLQEGLTSGDADIDGDGIIYAIELQKYLSKKVHEATDGKQMPTARVQNLSYDIPLLKVQ